MAEDRALTAAEEGLLEVLAASIVAITRAHSPDRWAESAMEIAMAADPPRHCGYVAELTRWGWQCRYCQAWLRLDLMAEPEDEPAGPDYPDELETAEQARQDMAEQEAM